jgi:hypothetical protein
MLPLTVNVTLGQPGGHGKTADPETVPLLVIMLKVSEYVSVHVFNDAVREMSVAGTGLVQPT